MESKNEITLVVKKVEILSEKGKICFHVWQS